MTKYEARRLTLSMTLYILAGLTFMATATAARAYDLAGVAIGCFTAGALLAFGISAFIWANKA